MPTFDNLPRLIKGALVGINPIIPIPNVLVTQYNVSQAVYGELRK